MTEQTTPQRVRLTRCDVPTMPDDGVRSYVTRAYVDVSVPTSFGPFIFHNVRVVEGRDGDLEIKLPRRPYGGAVARNGTTRTERLVTIGDYDRFLELQRAVLDAVRALHPEIFAAPVAGAVTSAAPAPEPDDPSPPDRAGLDHLLASPVAPATQP